MEKTYHIEPVETPRACEPMAVYQRTDPATYRHGVRPPSRTEEEMDRMAEEWLRPFTMEELHRRMDEAEAEIEAGEVMTSEEVFAEMERKYPWLCK